MTKPWKSMSTAVYSDYKKQEKELAKFSTLKTIRLLSQYTEAQYHQKDIVNDLQDSNQDLAKIRNLGKRSNNPKEKDEMLPVCSHL